MLRTKMAAAFLAATEQLKKNNQPLGKVGLRVLSDLAKAGNFNENGKKKATKAGGEKVDHA